MHIIKKKKEKRKIIAVIVSLLAIALISFVALYNTSIGSRDPIASDYKEDINYEPTTPEESKAAESSKVERENINKPSSTVVNPDIDVNRIEFNSLEQDPLSKDLTVKTKLYGVGWQKCKLSFTKDGTTISYDADVLYQPEFSTCLGFSIEDNQFVSAGPWTVTLTATGTNQLSRIVSTTVEIRK